MTRDTQAPVGETPLEAKLKARIRREGPIPVADYMRACLEDPEHGYYRRQAAIGAAGDFVTAPEISQVFGELLGLWFAQAWSDLGRPDPCLLVELGPGRGTLMADLLRAAAQVPGFCASLRLHLVETSARLRDLQRARLGGERAHWHTALDQVPHGPMLLVANEFLDALPVHQAVMCADGWHERVVTIAPDDTLAIALAADPLPHFEATLPRGLRLSPDGSIYEWRSDSAALEIGRRVRNGGAALLRILDLGRVAADRGMCGFAAALGECPRPRRGPGLPDRGNIVCSGRPEDLRRAVRRGEDSFR